MSELLGRAKPVIGMVHLAPLPGSPLYRGLTNQQILDAARQDLDTLLAAGFDAVSISNEGDQPYITTMPPETIALFTCIVSELTRGLPIPFGCGMLIDPKASLAVARAVGATFARLSFGVTAGAFGFVADSPGEILRYQSQIGAEAVKLFVGLSAHFSTSLDTRPLPEIARTTAVLAQPDAIQLYGAGAGVPPDLNEVAAVKQAVPEIPVIVASGVTAGTAAAALETGDAIIVGTSLKVDGRLLNPVDPQRADEFMVAVRKAREGSR
jgi:uncharacterized protein